MLWIDAVRADITKQSVKAIGEDERIKSSDVQSSPASILRWLSTTADPWLLALITQTTSRIRSKVLAIWPGANAVISSRNPAMKTLTGPNGHTEIDVLVEEKLSNFSCAVLAWIRRLKGFVKRPKSCQSRTTWRLPWIMLVRTSYEAFVH